jgi:hypothetical protein
MYLDIMLSTWVHPLCHHPWQLRYASFFIKLPALYVSIHQNHGILRSTDLIREAPGTSLTLFPLVGSFRSSDADAPIASPSKNRISPSSMIMISKKRFLRKISRPGWAGRSIISGPKLLFTLFTVDICGRGNSRHEGGCW